MMDFFSGSASRVSVGGGATSPRISVCVSFILIAINWNLHAVDPTYYEAVIQPIFLERCIGCHGKKKQKGELSLHTSESLLRGSENGDVIVPGDVSKSVMIELLRLPIDDEDHMPPEKKSQLTPAHIDAIEWWVKEGASFELLLSSKEIPEQFRTLKAPENETKDAPSQYAGYPEPDRKVLLALRKKLISIQRIEQGSNALWVDFTAEASETDDAAVALLRPIAENIAWLNLARTKISNQALAEVANMKNIVELDLRHAAITNAGLSKLTSLAKLEKLNLSYTNVTNAGIPHILALPALKKLYIYKSNITAKGVKLIRAKRPDLDFVGIKDPVIPVIEKKEPEAEKK